MIARRGRVRCLLIALATSLVAGHAPAAGTQLLEAAGEMVITAAPGTGLRMVVPQNVPMSRDDVVLELRSGTFASVIFARKCYPVGSDQPSVCTPVNALHLPGMAPLGGTFVAEVLPMGEYEVYVVGDAEVTVRLTLAGLAGRRHVTTRGVVAGSMVKLETHCPRELAPCEGLGYGGEVRTVTRPAIVHSISLAWIPLALAEQPVHVVNQGSTAVRACAAPSQGSGDPEYGCSSRSDDPIDRLNSTYRLALFLVGDTAHIQMVRTGVADPDGPVYAGFMARQASLAGGGGIGGYGVWISGPVACPPAACFEGID